ncbi:MAG: guanine deaminase [Jatrophihabitans sp.]|uniref:guanine deaminase n=1 Tax=Jatrophihabitans sp. TaxID=1932789 RepID=UPI00391153F2
MTIYRATVLDTPDNPFAGGILRAEADAGLTVDDGIIVDRGPFAAVRSRRPGDDVVDLRAGPLLPGLIDTHVHYPQLRVIGALGMPLLEWLDQCALPEEARLADVDYARDVAREFTSALVDAGTTSALVFGSHFPAAVEALFDAATERGLRMTSGLVVGDRLLRPELHTTAARAYQDGRALADRWHGKGRSRYAVIPRFSLSCSDDLLDSCAALHADLAGSWFTSHINENPAEIAKVRELFGGSYLDSYDKHGLVGPRTVFAHNVHPGDGELELLADAGATVSHCPTSNCALGSGLFEMDRHLANGVAVALGSDVGAGTGLSLFKEGLQAYLVQRMRGLDGMTLTAAQLLYLATAAGAAALGIADQVGDLSVGKRFDAVWLRPDAGTPLEIGLRHAADADAAVGKLFALATPHDVAEVWVDAIRIKNPAPRLSGMRKSVIV